MEEKLKRGDRVTVQLSQKHTLEGELVDHPAKFIRYHAAQPGEEQWADVDLDRPHSMDEQRNKVHVLSVPLSQIVAVLLLLFLFAIPAQAQDLGNVGLRTTNLVLANNVTCTGTLQLFPVPNNGQISHQAFAFSNAPSFVMEIDGSDGNINQYRISNPQQSFSLGGGVSTYTILGNGYYPLVKIGVTCTAASAFTLSYSGSQTAFGQVVGPVGGSTVPLGAGIAANVQGVVVQQGSGGAVDPIIEGGLQLPINASFLAVGLDTFNTAGVSLANGSSGTFPLSTAPIPTQPQELAISFIGNENDIGAGSTFSTPWTVVPLASPGCSAVCNAPIVVLSSANPSSSGQRVFETYSNSAGGPNILSINALVQTPGVTVRASSANSNSAASIGYSVNTLAGSALFYFAVCTRGALACSVGSVADTQGHTWQQVALVNTGTSVGLTGMSLWAATSVSTAAADTVTPTLASGTLSGQSVIEIPAVLPASLTQPAISVQADPTGRQIIAQDAQAPNQFVCSVTLSTATTTQCQPAPTTINNVPVRAYVTDFQINTTTAGAGSLLQPVTGTGANCGTGTANLSAITYSGAAVALQNVFGMRTPLIAPLQSAVCVKQTGATPSTSVVEIHGFFAP